MGTWARSWSRLAQAVTVALAALWFAVLGVFWATAADPAATPAALPIASPLASPPAASPDSARAEVSILRMRFDPFRLEVAVGTTVVWTNTVGVPHTVTARGRFDSGRLDHDAAFAQTFTEPGAYWYECFYHKDMVGLVVVSE